MHSLHGQASIVAAASEHDARVAELRGAATRRRAKLSALLRERRMQWHDSLEEGARLQAALDEATMARAELLQQVIMHASA